MNRTDQSPTSTIWSKLVTIALFLLFAAGLFLVLEPFIVPVAWGMILVTAMWPAYERLRAMLGGRQALASILMTSFIALISLGVLIPLSWEFASELSQMTSSFKKTDLQSAIGKVGAIPTIGPLLRRAVENLLLRDNVTAFVNDNGPQFMAIATSAARGVVSTVAVAIASVLTCYVFFRHGELIAGHLRGFLGRVGGVRLVESLDMVHATVRGAAYSVILTAIAQGTLAGLGFSVAGAPVPVFFGFATMALALLPFGAPLIYVPLSAYLFFTGAPWYAWAGLLAWGLCVVSMVDNILRPLFISQAVKLPMLLIFVGVIGGIMAFGLLGVFVGPALLAVAHQLWFEFIAAAPSNRGKDSVVAGG